MQVLEAYKPFEIQEIELHTWQQRPVKNNFFELVLIQEGSGIQCINYHEYPYAAGSIFLLPPLQCHSFHINQRSRFIFIKFTSDFFLSNKKKGVDQNAWFKEAAYILSNYNQRPGDIIHNELDRQHLHALINLIRKENQNYGMGSEALIKSLMTSILEVLLRNIKRTSFHDATSETGNDERVAKLLGYIHEHIGEPKRLRVEQLAKEFLFSSNYLSEYFRKNMHISLREYIIKARLKQVEIRLLNSPYTLSQIADDLGFTDVSHLSKTFKRYTGNSVREFKQKGEYQLLKRATQ